jgi:hypothetical protein
LRTANMFMGREKADITACSWSHKLSWMYVNDQSSTYCGKAGVKHLILVVGCRAAS